MFGPHSLHLLVGCEFTAVGCRLGAGNRLALFRRKDNWGSKVGTCELHDGTRDVILIVRWQSTHDLNCFIKELCHRHNIRLGGVGVEEQRNVAGGCGIRQPQKDQATDIERYRAKSHNGAPAGTSDEDIMNLALWLKKNRYRADQVQAFLPSPMATATAMYHTGVNPLRGVRHGGRTQRFTTKGVRATK